MTTPRPRYRRLRRWFLITTIILVTGLAFLFLFRDALALRGARWGAERFAGYRLVAEDLHVHSLGRVSVEGLGLTALREDQPLRSLEVNQGTVRVHPWRLVGGEGLGGIESVEAQGLNALVELGRGPTEPDTEPVVLPRRLPRVTLTDAKMTVRTATGDRYEVEHGEVEVADHGEEANRITLTLPEPRYLPDGGEAMAPGAIQGRLVYRDGGAVEVESLTVGPSWKVAGTVDLRALGGGALGWDGRVVIAGAGEVASRGEAQDGRLTGDATVTVATVAGLRRDPLLHSVAGAGGWPAVDGRVEVEGRFDLPLAAPLEGEGTVRWSARGMILETMVKEGGTLSTLPGALQRIDDAAGTAVLAGGVLRIPEGEIHGVGEDRLSLTDLALPLAELQGTGAPEATPEGAVPPFLGAFLGAAEGRFTVSVADLQRYLPTAPAPIAVELAARLGAARLVVERGRVAAGGGWGEIEEGALWVTEGDAVAGRLRAALDFPDLAALTPLLLSGTPLEGSAAGRVQLTGRWAEVLVLEGEGEGEVAKVRFGELPIDAGRLVATFDGTALHAAPLTMRGPWGWLEATGGYRWSPSPGALLAVVLAGEITDTAPLATYWSFGGTGRFEGTLAGRAARPGGRVAFTGGGFDFGGFAVPELAFTAVSGGDGDLRAEGVEALTGMGAVTGAVALHWPGGMASGLPLELAVGPFTLASEGVALTLENPAEAPARIRFQEDGVRFQGVRLQGSAGRLEIDAATLGERLQLTVLAENLDPAPFLRPWWPEGVAVDGVDAHLTGSTAAAIEGDFALARLRLTAVEAPLRVAGRGRWQGDRLRLEDLTVQGPEGATRAAVAGEIPLDLSQPLLEQAGPVRLTGSVDLPRLEVLPQLTEAVGGVVAGRLEARFDLGGRWRGLTGQMTVAGTDLYLPVPQTLREAKAQQGESGGVVIVGQPRPEPPETLGPFALDGRLELAEVIGEDGEDGEDGEGGQGGGAAGGIELQPLALTLPSGDRLAVTGRVGVPLDVTRLATTWDPASTPLELVGDVAIADLSWITPFVPSVRHLKGQVEGRVEVAGTVVEPRLGGALHLREGTLRLTGGGLPLDHLAGDLAFQGDTVEVRSLRAELGGAPVAVQGSLRFVEGGPECALRLQGENLLLMRSSTLRLRADADLALEGPWDRARVTGQVALRNSRLTQNIDLLAMLGAQSTPTAGPGLQFFSFTDPPLADLQFDVRVVTAEPFQLFSNLARGGARLDLHLGGTGRVPIPTGTLYLTRSQLRLPSGILDIPGGTATFTERDPFVPRLEVSGEARLRGYDVQMRMSGSLEAPEIFLSSNPPLANGALTLLVLTGQLPGGAAQAAGESVAVFLAFDFLSRWSSTGWGSGAGGDDWWQRFRLVTGRDISERGVETTEASYRLRQDLVSDHDTLFLVAERDRYEDYNFGVRWMFRFDTVEGETP